MSFTYDFNTEPLLSTVRLLISDTDASLPVFQDVEINQFIYLESSQNLYVSGQAAPNGTNLQSPPVPQVYSPYRAAALALNSMTANVAQSSAIVKRLLDVELDGKSSAQMLRDLAQSYRDIEANAGHWAVAEMVQNAFSARERVYKQLLRLYGGG